MPPVGRGLVYQKGEVDAAAAKSTAEHSAAVAKIESRLNPWEYLVNARLCSVRINLPGAHQRRA